MYRFDVKQVTRECINWIKEFFDENGKDCNAVIGISGGVDSSVVAALCVQALGTDRVKGVLIPNADQDDIDDSYELCEHLGIWHTVINIEDCVNLPILQMNFPVSKKTRINLPARIRMAVLYACSQSLNGRVANTCNLSEDYVGYSTRYGDMAGDFSPLSGLTKTEVKVIGRCLGLPDHLVDKVPTDGLCGKTDEENLGFTYDILDRYIRTGYCEDSSIEERIDHLHHKNEFKMRDMPRFRSNNIDSWHMWYRVI